MMLEPKLLLDILRQRERARIAKRPIPPRIVLENFDPTNVADFGRYHLRRLVKTEAWPRLRRGSPATILVLPVRRPVTPPPPQN